MMGVWTYVEKYQHVIATNLSSICCVYKEKIVKKKKTQAEQRSVNTNSKVAMFDSDR